MKPKLIKCEKLMKCENCGIMLPPDKIFSYVDGNNISITKNSPNLCEDCFQKFAKQLDDFVKDGLDEVNK